MSAESYFRLSVQLKIRRKEIQLRAAARPNSLSSTRSDIEMQIHEADLGKEEKVLAERLFDVLLGLDIRLQRLEEQVGALLSGNPKSYEVFREIPMELGAEGIVVSKEVWPFGEALEKGDGFEIVLPFVPEWPFQTSLQMAESVGVDSYHFRFKHIHKDDQELIHRYLRVREREVLRARRSESKETKTEAI